MTQIKELLERDLSRRIAEVIQVDQADEHAVYSELTEYVVTDRIKSEYERLLRAMAEAPSDPDEGIGVWISGFFGSGKSSFAKNLGYVLANPEVMGHSAAALFKGQVRDSKVAGLVDSINARIPTAVVMFDVQKDRSQAGHGGLSISPFVYRVLLRELGYAEDFDLAELEISLEREGRLDEFVRRYNARFVAGDAASKQAWNRQGRKSSEVWNRAGVILHEMDPETYQNAESFARQLVEKRVDVTPRLLVDRTFELAARRRPGQAVAFIVDEVGQYVAYSQERLEDLRAVVEEFGKESKNRVVARQTPAPVWFVITSQERLDEVTSAMSDERRVLLAKVQDRFRHEIDLAPSDIREVATRRVLGKTDEGHARLVRLFDEHQGKLNTACRLERSTRLGEVSRDEFARFYPYLPHYVDLCIDIMAGIRLQPGAQRHIGGSNRTIISQVYQMLVNPRTAFGDRAVGALVSLDKVYELIEGQVGSARQKDIGDVTAAFKDDPADGGWAARVAKTVCLLEFVRDLPRTEANIAALLVDQVGAAAPLLEARAALERLTRAQFVRNSEDGYKLQTAQEKNWETERRGFVPKPKDRGEIVREAVGEALAEARVRDYRWSTKTFRVGLTVDGVRVGDEGPLDLSLAVAEAPEALATVFDRVVVESRQTTHQNRLYWAVALDPPIDELVASLFAGRQMIARYDGLRAQGQISADEATSLTNEKREVGLLAARLKERMDAALARGQGAFRGVTRDGAGLGKDVGEILRAFYGLAVPQLYTKLELGSRPVKGKGAEVEAVLTAANLNALPHVFYGAPEGLDLVIKDGPRYLPNKEAPIAKEILDYLAREHSYGNKVTGKELESHFGGIPYGWDLDIVQIVLALLLRGGVIEVISTGRRFRSAEDPQCREPLTNNPKFRAASFAPRQVLDTRTLVKAVTALEGITGEEVDVEETAIAAAFKTLAAEDMARLLDVIATFKANNLPGLEALTEYQQTLQAAQAAPSDDCVATLAGQGAALKETRSRVWSMSEIASEARLSVIRQARTASTALWPALSARRLRADLGERAERLGELLRSEELYQHLREIEALAGTIAAAYAEEYHSRHRTRYSSFAGAMDEISARAEWGLLSPEVREPLLTDLSTRACRQPGAEWRTGGAETQDAQAGEAALAPGGSACARCGASLREMESDLAALPGLYAKIVARLHDLTEDDGGDDGRKRVQRVRLLDFFQTPLDSPEAVEQTLAGLQTYLLKLVAEGTRIVAE